MPEPTIPPIAYKVETWAIDALREHSIIPSGFAVVHANEEVDAKNNRIVCTATTGAKDSGGVKPWGVTLEVKLILVLKEKHTLEHYTRAIEETFKSPPTVASQAEFSYLNILETDDDEEKDERPDSRQRVRSYLLQALEAEESDSELMFSPSGNLMFVPEDELMFV